MKTFVLCNGNNKNSYGFSVNLSGMDLSRFTDNPIMLYNHDSERVIGRWLNVRVEDNKLLADADIDVDDKLGKEIARKVEKGYLKACSIGMYIKSMIESDNELIASQTELLEASIVPVPSDAGAITLYDEQNKPTTLAQVRLQYNLQTKNMDQKFELTPATLTALGLDKEHTAQAVELAVAAKDAQIATLTGEIAEMKQAKVNELIDLAIAEKKIGADEKETYLSLAETNYEGVSKILSRMKGVTPVKQQLNPQGVASKYAGKSWDELDRAGLLASLKAEDPEQYNTLYKQKFNA